MLQDLIKYYEKDCDEENRLQKDNAHKIEFLTSVKYFEQYFTPNSKILDACAGTGIYSFFLAEKGHSVTSGDIVPYNVSIILDKQRKNPILSNVYTGDVLDLSRFEPNSFDVVLCMGALYHLQTIEQRDKAISECLRVLKTGGIIVVAYINKKATALDILNHNLSNMDEILEYHSSGIISQFYGTTPEEIELSMNKFTIDKLSNIGSDGLWFLLKDKINNASENNFHKWLKYYWTLCEDENTLGYSLHGLFFGKKT
ncbi:MAG: class I SAM-dependent methyltransferase [Fibrobacteres bacterium]|nr:class I SAM-dependent methyltransferase [Fibrobacterota bacterium]